MRAVLRIIAAVLILAGLGAGPLAAQAPPPPGTYLPGELIDTGHKFFGTVSRGLATVIEKAVSQWGQPNGYILGQEGSGGGRWTPIRRSSTPAWSFGVPAYPSFS